MSKVSPKIFMHKHDLADWVDFSTATSVSIDTEAMGLKFGRDRLCLIQLTFDQEVCHLVQFPADSYQVPVNLFELFNNKDIVKIFHFARFDCGLIYDTFQVMPQNIYCTKIASKLARTYTEKHGLKTLCNELLKVEVSKKEQSSDWGKDNLTDEQKRYAASDVMYLLSIKEKLDEILAREGRAALAEECFHALGCIIKLDCAGWSENLFAHL